MLTRCVSRLLTTKDALYDPYDPFLDEMHKLDGKRKQEDYIPDFPFNQNSGYQGEKIIFTPLDAFKLFIDDQVDD